MPTYCYSTYLAFLALIGFAPEKKAPTLTEPTTPTLTEPTKQFFQSILFDNRPEFNRLCNQIPKNIKLADGTTPLQFAVQHRAYEQCIRLIHEKFSATVQDLDQAQLMKDLERSHTRQCEAGLCIDSIQKYLEELNLIPKTNLTRGKESQAAQIFAYQLNSKEYALIQATASNKIATMNQLLESGINPNAEINGIRPIDVAIAQGHEEAVRYLLNMKAKIDDTNVARAHTMIEILHTTSLKVDDQDLTYTNARPNPAAQTNAHVQALRKAQKIHQILLAHLGSSTTSDKVEKS